MDNIRDLTIDTYDDIDDISPQELCARLERDYGFSSQSQYPLIKQYNLMNKVCEWVGLKPCNEQIMFMMTNHLRVLCEAVAGSGKTTISQMRIIRNKIFENIKGYDVLCIAYNEHAVKDMVSRHRDLVNIINSKQVKGLNIDSEIFCKTFHSYCLMWVNEYRYELKLSKSGEQINILSDGEQTVLMRKAIETCIKGTDLANTIPKFLDKCTASMISFYSNIRESMTPPESYHNITQFYETGIQDLAVLEKIFKKYETVKKFKSKYDFTDILIFMLKLLEENQEARERIQTSYPVVLVDEYQDFTTLMRTILKKMIKPETSLTCVGDGDQSIYSFRGADSLNCIKFRYEFDNPLIVSMGKNRRCKSNIVDVGRSVIETNTLRNKKKIKSVKEGGTVRNLVYSDLADQYSRIVEELDDKITKHYKDNPKQLLDLSNICICYRNKESSFLLTNLLMQRNIPFTLGSGFRPFQDLLDRSLMDIIYLLKRPDDKDLIKDCFWKLVPSLSSKDLAEVVNSLKDYTNFYEIQYPERYTKIASFSRALVQLRECSEKVRKGYNLCEVIPTVFNLLKLFYWNYQKEQRKFPDELENVVLAQYNVELNFAQFIEKKNKQIARIDEYEKFNNGVYLTTFHGLKGLEFDEVYVIDLDDDIFPNFEANNNYKYTEEVKNILKEECTCLMYVVCTRARDKVTFMWNKERPSYYKTFVDQARVGSKIEEGRKHTSTVSDFIEIEDYEIEIDDDVDLTLEDDDIEIDDDLDLTVSFEDEDEDEDIIIEDEGFSLDEENLDPFSDVDLTVSNFFDSPQRVEKQQLQTKVARPSFSEERQKNRLSNILNVLGKK